MQPTVTTQEPLITVNTRLVGPLEVTFADYAIAQLQAKRKLARIIEREGDADGERLKPYYIEQLTAEAIIERQASKATRDLMRLSIEKKRKPTTEAEGNPNKATLLYHEIYQNAIGG